MRQQVNPISLVPECFILSGLAGDLHKLRQLFLHILNFLFLKLDGMFDFIVIFRVVAACLLLLLGGFELSCFVGGPVLDIGTKHRIHADMVPVGLVQVQRLEIHERV